VIVGVPTEIKPDEYRVAITPIGVRELVEHGHDVVIQAGAGEGSAISDSDYTAQGARILPGAEDVFGEAEMVLGVKEPQPQEVAMLRPEQTLFTYLHLAPAPELTPGLCDSAATCVAYETVEDSEGRLPLLAPMSEVAGKIATQAGAFMLEKPLGGRGILLGGVPGVAPANVMVIGGVLVHGARAPHVIRRKQLALMKPHAVLVDVAIDQGGCFETSRPTTHTEPTYEVDGIIHYCVTNMPGAVPITSTYALTNATLPYVLALADLGVSEAARRDPGLRLGINVAGGKVTHPAVAEGVGMEYVAPERVLDIGEAELRVPGSDGAGATATHAIPNGRN
jgi:alanine dehydrogenase